MFASFFYQQRSTIFNILVLINLFPLVLRTPSSFTQNVDHNGIYFIFKPKEEKFVRVSHVKALFYVTRILRYSKRLLFVCTYSEILWIVNFLSEGKYDYSPWITTFTCQKLNPDIVIWFRVSYKPILTEANKLVWRYIDL